MTQSDFKSFRDKFIYNPRTKKADINVKSVFDFFNENTNSTLRIPLYQRPYSWGIAEVNTLLKDIKKSIAKKEDWFIGPLFTAENEEDYNSYIDILDGQQRITTLVIILRILFTIENFNNGKCFIFLKDVDEETKNKNLEEYKQYKDSIKSMLLRYNPTASRFHTDNSTKENFNLWIQNLSVVNAENYSLFKSLENTEKSDFSQTKANLNKNIDSVYKYFEDIASKPNSGINDINNTIGQILNHLYLIHIPLINNNEVLDIFETLNNRGKPLNLTDIIRFKTISKYNDIESKREELEKLWNKFFKHLDAFGKIGFFKNSDSFLERYINAISEKSGGYTNNTDRIERFENKYDKDFLTGVNEMIHVLEVLDFIFTSSRLTSLISNKSESEMISALIKVCEKALLASENSQILFIAYCIKVHDEKAHARLLNTSGHEGYKPLCIFIFQFIKFVISTDIYQDLGSNDVRGVTIELSRRLNHSNIYTQKCKEDSDFRLDGLHKQYVKNIALITHDRKGKLYTELILSYYQLIIKFSQLNVISEKFSSRQCDHIIPDKWYKKSCWTDKLDKETLKDEIDKINNEKIKLALYDLIEEGLWNDTSSRKSFVQLIGNKIYIGGKTNLVKSNNCWEDTIVNGKTKTGAKKTLENYLSKQRNNSFIIPTYNLPSEQEQFDLENVISRTENILSTIFENDDLLFWSIKEN